MKYSENVLNILTLQQYKGIGNSWISKNIKGNENGYTFTENGKKR